MTNDLPSKRWAYLAICVGKFADLSPTISSAWEEPFAPSPFRIRSRRTDWRQRSDGTGLLNVRCLFYGAETQTGNGISSPSTNKCDVGTQSCLLLMYSGVVYLSRISWNERKAKLLRKHETYTYMLCNLVIMCVQIWKVCVNMVKCRSHG